MYQTFETSSRPVFNRPPVHDPTPALKPFRGAAAERAHLKQRFGLAVHVNVKLAISPKKRSTASLQSQSHRVPYPP